MLVLQVICGTLIGLIAQQVSSSQISGDPSSRYHKGSFFAMRMDTREGTCVSKFVNVFHPIYEFGQSIGNGFWDWSKSWQLSGLEKNEIKMGNSHVTGDTYLLTNGSNYFQLLDKERFFMNPWEYLSDDSRPSPRINILAANATLLLTDSENWEGKRGTLIELDHVNPETNEKETRVRICSYISLREERKCKTVLQLNKTNYLQDGKRYATFFIENQENCKNERCISTHHLYSGKNIIDLLGTWRKKWAKQDFVFARSNANTGLFMNEKQLSIAPIPGSASPKMSKIFTQANGGKLVVHVVWKDYSNTPTLVQMYARKIDTNFHAYATCESKYNMGLSNPKKVSRVVFEDLEAGEYELTLYNLTKPIKNIYLCSENLCAPEQNNIPHQRIVGCHMFLGEMLIKSAETTLSDSSQCHFNVSPRWTAGDLSYVCAQLGFKNTECHDVEIKLCNNYGCVFTSCPKRGRQPTFTAVGRSTRSINARFCDKYQEIRPEPERFLSLGLGPCEISYY